MRHTSTGCAVPHTSTVYTVKNAFLGWLKQHRPGVAKFIIDGNYKEINMLMPPPGSPNTRHLLQFPGVPVTCLAPEIADHFDRQVTSNDACVVLDNHPDSLNKKRKRQ